MNVQRCELISHRIKRSGALEYDDVIAFARNSENDVIDNTRY